MFWSLPLSSISLATDTPSLVTVGAPKERSSTTLRPLGPRVTFTALARMFTPSTMRARASPPKMTSFAAMLLTPEYQLMWGWKGLALDDREQVVFLHDQQFVAIDLD